MKARSQRAFTSLNRHDPLLWDYLQTSGRYATEAATQKVIVLPRCREATQSVTAGRLQAQGRPERVEGDHRRPQPMAMHSSSEWM